MMTTQTRDTLKELLNLAWPVVLARIGIMTMGLTDAIVVGHYASRELAYHSLAWAPSSVVLTTAVGLMMGVQILTARLRGEGRHGEIGAVLRRGMVYALQIGIASMLALAVFGPWVMQSVRFEEGLGAGRVRSAGGLRPVDALLSGVRRGAVLPGGPVAAQAGHVRHVGGQRGEHRPEPAAGAGPAGTGRGRGHRLGLGDLLGAGVLGRLPRHLHRPTAGGSRARNLFDTPRARSGRRRAPAGHGRPRLGLVLLHRGRRLRPDDPLSPPSWERPRPPAWAIVLNISAIVFMLPMGLSSATAVLVGRAYGAHDSRAVLRNGLVGVGVVTALTLIVALIVWPSAPLLIGAYNRDPALAVIAIPALVLATLFFVADGIQVVAAQANRAAGDVWWPTIMHFTAYGAIMMPLGWWLSQSFGVDGLVWAVIIASLVSSTLLTGRFVRIARRLRWGD
jgi:MATE family multidrug resistance protein